MLKVMELVSGRAGFRGFICSCKRRHITPPLLLRWPCWSHAELNSSLMCEEVWGPTALHLCKKNNSSLQLFPPEVNRNAQPSASDLHKRPCEQNSTLPDIGILREGHLEPLRAQGKAKKA